MSQQPDSPCYLGEGVYATHDGHHIVLRTNAHEEGGVYSISLSPAVFEALLDYRRRVVESVQRAEEGGQPGRHG